MPDNRDASGKPLPPEKDRFRPGVSGNPGGKSPEREALRRECQDYFASTSLENLKAIEVIAQTAKSDKVRLAARIWWAEQFVGKPVQAISGPNGGPVQTVDLSKLTLEQLEKLEEIRKAAAGE